MEEKGYRRVVFHILEGAALHSVGLLICIHSEAYLEAFA